MGYATDIRKERNCSQSPAETTEPLDGHLTNVNYLGVFLPWGDSLSRVGAVEDGASGCREAVDSSE